VRNLISYIQWESYRFRNVSIEDKATRPVLSKLDTKIQPRRIRLLIYSDVLQNNSAGAK
jgi:hypothetical protein